MEGYKKGLWTVEEDGILMEYIRVHGKGRWNRISKITGLKRCGKSCRLRWINYLSPNVKRGDFSEEEDDLIIRLHNLLGNRWSLIAGRVPGRTDNQVKNHWNTNLSKKLGVRKGKSRSSVGASSSSSTSSSSSQEISMKVEKGLNYRSSESINSQPHFSDNNNGGDDEEKVIQDGSHGEVVGLFSSKVEEQIMNEGYDEDSFWFCHDMINQDPPNFVEFLGDYSLDFLWHGL